MGWSKGWTVSAYPTPSPTVTPLGGRAPTGMEAVGQKENAYWAGCPINRVGMGGQVYLPSWAGVNNAHNPPKHKHWICPWFLNWAKLFWVFSLAHSTETACCSIWNIPPAGLRFLWASLSLQTGGGVLYLAGHWEDKQNHHLYMLHIFKKLYKILIDITIIINA